MTKKSPLETITKEKNNDLSIDERIKLYEKVENSLQEFFNSTTFCYDHCFSKEEAVVGWRRGIRNIVAPGNEGCCHNNSRKFYDFHFGLDSFFKVTNNFWDEFPKRQLENLKENFCQTGTCEYHADSGCAIEKLRSPVCNSWVCENYKIYISNNFKINYSGNSYSDNSVSALLGIVFDKEVHVGQIEDTISKIKKATKRIKNHKEWKEYVKRIKI